MILVSGINDICARAFCFTRWWANCTGPDIFLLQDFLGFNSLHLHPPPPPTPGGRVGDGGGGGRYPYICISDVRLEYGYCPHPPIKTLTSHEELRLWIWESAPSPRPSMEKWTYYEEPRLWVSVTISRASHSVVLQTKGAPVKLSTKLRDKVACTMLLSDLFILINYCSCYNVFT